MIADITNGGFQLLGAVMVLNHCRVTVRDDAVAGVSVLSVAFFAAWGVWNLYYFPSLGQWWSFVGGVATTAAHLLWIALILRARRRALRSVKVSAAIAQAQLSVMAITHQQRGQLGEPGRIDLHEPDVARSVAIAAKGLRVESRFGACDRVEE